MPAPKFCGYPPWPDCPPSSGAPVLNPQPISVLDVVRWYKMLPEEAIQWAENELRKEET